MKRVGIGFILSAVLLRSLVGCVLNKPLDACFVIVDDPAGDPMTRVFSAACSTHFEEPFYPTEIYTFKWYFGDGHTRMVSGNVVTTYTYREPGTYTIELLIMGPDGETARTKHQVIIAST